MKPGRATKAVRVTRHRGGEPNASKDAVAVEEPLEIRVAWSPTRGVRHVESLTVTMRTPDHDFELVAGFLYGEGVIAGPEELAELTYCRDGEGTQEYNVVEARLAPGVDFDLGAVRRNVYTTSSCGVCGKASLEAVAARQCPTLGEGPSVAADLLARLPERLLEGQGVFERTGGLHAAGLFRSNGEPLIVMEDVGRHNAVDKVVGHALLQRWLPMSDAVLCVSGRASYELAQKAIVAGIPLLVAVGAPSSLAIDLARRFRQTLVGFARDGGFNVYCGGERVA